MSEFVPEKVERFEWDDRGLYRSDKTAAYDIGTVVAASSYDQLLALYQKWRRNDEEFKPR